MVTIKGQHKSMWPFRTCVNEASLVGESNHESRNDKGIDTIHFGQELIDNTIPGHTGITLITRATTATTRASHGIKFIHDNYM